MKVLLITKTIESKGGAGRYSNEIYKALLGCDISVAVLSESNKLLSLSRFKMIKFLMNVFIARREVANFDIIHALDVWPYGVYGYFAALGSTKRLFINGVGTYSVLSDSGVIKKFLMRHACLYANRIFCISEYTKKRILEKINLNNLSVVFYGAFILQFLDNSKINYYKKKYDIKKYYPIFLTVGDIKNRKGQLDTLRALNLLKDKYKNFLYIMIGTDEDIFYINKIKNFITENNLNNNIKIISNMYNDEELAFFYQICDIFLLNSNNDKEHFEGFGGVFLEAAQFGKPAIGSKNCGIESAIRDGVSGYLTTQADHKNIKDKILLSIKNKEMLSRGATNFYRDFSWKKTVDQYLGFYSA